jgi:hypothetical protein
MLNLSRQFADIGVTAAMGMNPLMILVQQGPQIADVFATARSRGIGTLDVVKQIGSAALPLASRLLSIGTVAGLAFGTLGLAARGAGLDLGNVQTELGLTEKQMDRLKDKGTDLGYTMTDIMAGIASAVADALDLDDVARAWNNGLDKLGKDAIDFVRDTVGFFGGMIGAIKAGFNDIPGSIAAVFQMAMIKYLEFLNDVFQRATNSINYFRKMLGFEGNLQAWHVDVPKMSAGAQGAWDSMSKGYGEGKASAQSAFDKGMASHRRARILEDAGDPGKEKHGPKPKKSEEEKDYDRAVQGAENYIKALQKETEAIGKNRFEVKQLATEREAAELNAAARAFGTSEAMAKAAELTAKMREETDKWAAATNAEGIRKFKERLDDQAEAMRFAQSLIGKSNEEQAKANKTREISIEILALERDGYHGLAEALRESARAVIDLAGAEGKRKDMAEEAKRTATAAKDMADNVRDATSSFSELFGTVGEGFANVMTTIYDHLADQEDAYSRLAEIQSKYADGQKMSAEDQFEAGRIQNELLQGQIAVYGDLLGAAKTFFKEGSTGWKILEGAERVYRLFQFAMMIRSMFLDKAQTTSSVANSGARAAADGIAAVAKAIASLPFPLNIAAGAATLAFLVAIGVKMAKGGGGSSASASMQEKTQPINVYGGPTDNYGAPTSGYSVLRPGMTTVSGQPNAYGQGGSAGVVIHQGDTNITVQGSMDTPTMEQLVPILDANRQASVQDARQAVAADLAAKTFRQRIGG